VPAEQRHESPPEQLGRLAQTARRQGLPFDEFWLRAVRPGLPAVRVTTPAEKRPEGAIAWPHDHRDRQAAAAALEATKEGWRRAYEQVPPRPGEVALALLAPILANGSTGAIVGAGLRSAA
jgi:hypothetical protein